ncbi:GTP-binding protein Era [Coriobacterium glomerans PW2]|uniref:GTPase Era n=1 Tax=Coriobacterium glomerans (strain ATCC 49209 / DSM 20642 / JCM 10262 / PW2) TaxID=700015 RepID=F2N7Q6_CORGP|nr:GTP-binding protein Era [Coriobacterium glomerans PW2]
MREDIRDAVERRHDWNRSEQIATADDGVEEFHSGFVALVGRPNAGKSTLLNAIFGKKIAITSNVVQTTRRRLRAVVNRPGCQIVFVDTPGLHKPQDSLGRELNKGALAELVDVDVVALTVDATKPVGSGDRWVAERVARTSAVRVLVITKADLATPEMVASQIAAVAALCDFDETIAVSATEGFNVEALIEIVSSHLPVGPHWFPDDAGADATDEQIVAEFVREKALRRTREEIPHAVGVACDSLALDGSLVRAHATILVERDSQKGILIGSGGEMIKRIGTDARRDLERLFDRKVFLALDVRVQPDWRDDGRVIRRLGYGAEA